MAILHRRLRSSVQPWQIGALHPAFQAPSRFSLFFLRSRRALLKF